MGHSPMSVCPLRTVVNADSVLLDGTKYNSTMKSRFRGLLKYAMRRPTHPSSTGESFLHYLPIQRVEF